MLRLTAPLLMLALLTGPLRADPPPPDLGALLDIAEAPFQQRDAVERQLAEALPLFTPMPEPAQPGPTLGDLYYWSLEGRFGLHIEGTNAPGGFVTCARYGRITLERLQELPSSDPRVFPLMRQAAILHDDASAWPEQAVARLVCQVTWDDGRRVAPLSVVAVVAELQTVFDDVVTRPDPRERPGETRVFGPGGYQVAGGGAAENSFFQLDLFEIDQLATHHQILFRSFLIGGGV